MREPAFWWGRPGARSAALAPAGLVYAAVARRRLRRPSARAPVPVVCIGNMSVGGAGKTPTAIAVAALLAEAGRRSGFLLRGYGGREGGPLLVDPGRHGAADVGDEALLLARHAPTAVARRRPAGAELLAAEGVDVVVMDDGMQNPSLAKDLVIAVVDGARGHGNGRVVPAGPLRLPEGEQWRLADALLVVGEGAAGARVAERARQHGKPVLTGRLRPDPAACLALAGRPVVAFAGIGRPEKFFATLRECGAVLRAAHPFPDHHAYEARSLARLREEAARHGAVLVTTEKDAVRLRPAPDGLATLPVRLVLDEPERAAALLFGRLG